MLIMGGCLHAHQPVTANVTLLLASCIRSKPSQPSFPAPHSPLWALSLLLVRLPSLPGAPQPARGAELLSCGGCFQGAPAQVSVAGAFDPISSLTLFGVLLEARGSVVDGSNAAGKRR